MTDFIVTSGQTSSGLVLGPNDSLTVASGGDVSTSIFQYAPVTIETSGHADSDIVTDLAVENVHGVDSFSTVADGGTIVVLSDGSVFDINVLAGGTLVVSGNAVPAAGSGVASNTVVSVGGVMQVEGNGACRAHDRARRRGTYHRHWQRDPDGAQWRARTGHRLGQRGQRLDR